MKFPSLLAAMASSGAVVLSYNDSLLRQSDVLLLEPSRWLNDTVVIGFAFQYFSHNLFSEVANSVAFVSPEVTQLIKLCCDDDIPVLLASLELSEKRLVLFAVNDNDSAYDVGGSHWSLLSWQQGTHPADSSWIHYDSSSGGNSGSAKYLANRLKNLLKGAFSEVEKCPQQQNGSDCGIYTICFAEFLATVYSSDGNAHQSLQQFVAQDKVTHKRQDLRKLIESLGEK